MHATGSVLADRYRVLRPLGTGGMATVFLCLDERLSREVAVKRLHAHSPEDAARRFAREARLGASLNHPNLVTVFDTIADEEALLIVMEHVPGATLREVLRDGPLTPDAASSLVADVAAGLDHAHAHAVTHRDVKPGNVLLRDDGVAKLVDLGIAVAADQTRITQSGTVLGTAAYMAPEQLEGKPTGPATDVYALAAVAYEALAGQRARSGRTALEIAHRIATEPPPGIRELRPELSQAVADALGRAMARDPGERQQSAGAFARELGRGLADAPATSPTRPLRQGPLTAAAADDPRGPGSRARGAGAIDDTEAGNRRPRRHPRASSSTAPDRVQPASGPAGRRSHGSAVADADGPGMAGPAKGMQPARALDRPSGFDRRPWEIAVLVLAVLAVAGLALAGGNDGGDGGAGDRRARNASPASDAKRSVEHGGGGASAQTENGGASRTAGEEASAQSGASAPGDGSSSTQAYVVPEPTRSDPAAAGSLNDQGFRMLSAGRAAEAIPLLEQAVRSARPDEVDPYAYALFNLGSALRQAGRAEDAIPVLERRLGIPDQIETVRVELERARRAAEG